MSASDYVLHVLSKTKQTDRRKKIVNMIKDSGPSGIALGSMQRFIQTIPIEERNTILAELVENGDIEMEVVETKSRPKIIFRAI